MSSKVQYVYCCNNKSQIDKGSTESKNKQNKWAFQTTISGEVDIRDVTHEVDRPRTKALRQLQVKF